MARARRFSPLLALLAPASVGLALGQKTAMAQQGAGVAQKPGSPAASAAQATPGRPYSAQVAPQTFKLKSPVPFRVYQRDVNDKADIPIVMDDFDKEGSTFVSAAVTPNPGNAKITFDQAESKLVGVPLGGPYTINFQIKHETPTTTTATVANIYVGDLWVLAGQSNMEGVGDLVDVTPPHPRVMLLGMDGRWGIAEEPLHWLVDSPDPIHSGDASTRTTRSAQSHKSRKKGAGLGLPFAVAMVESTGVPVGLVACAHGGTSMEQWNPSKKEQGGKSLYGSMLRQVKEAGGKVKGVLWYQGESDSLGGNEAWKTYPRVFSDFIAAVRSDLGQPELPFYYVQIGRFISGNNPRGWNAVQDAQRTLPERVPNTAVVSVIDLELDDGIHVGTQGLKRAGQRLAKVALREQFGQLGATTPTLDRVTRGPNNTLVLKFKGVNMSTHLNPGGGGRGFGRGMSPSGMMAGGTGNIYGQSNMVSPGDASSAGLKPERTIAGFSIRKEDGTDIPLIFEAAVGKARDTVILKLAGPVPPHAALWYGHGLNTYCNLTDGFDMSVPVFGPIDLDDTRASVAAASAASAATSTNAAARGDAAPIKVLIITGDTVSVHKWKETTAELTKILEAGGKAKVSVTTTPSKDLNDENLAKYDVMFST
jgi:sialate O-acetylesterase